MKFILTFIILFFGKNLLGQNIIIKDNLLQTPIENATLESEKSGLLSDKNGMVNISVFDKNDTIKISHVAYHNKIIIKQDILNGTIYLNQKTTMLPAIMLTEYVKTPLSEKYPSFSIKPKGLSLIETSISDLISNESSVVVQESQAGGGSLNYRGMEASRLLLVVDGVMLNNAIYRSGHLQSSSTINPFFIQSINLLSGPASVAYGNGAMGGALIFNTIKVVDTNSINLHQQFESNNSAVTTSFLAKYYSNKISQVTGVSIKSADNLRMGKNRLHGYEGWGEENGVINEQEQLYTSYNKADFIHKVKYQINEQIQILSNTQYSISSNIYRFDKMNDLVENELKYLKWYYGPQTRFLQKIEFLSRYKSIFFNSVKLNLSYQKLIESRHKQKQHDSLLNNRCENVKIYDVGLDFNKYISDVSLVYGLGARAQTVLSNASLNDNENTFYNTTRYPSGGSKIQDVFAYSQINIPVNKKLDVFIGTRWNNALLNASFTDSIFTIEDVKNKNSSFVNSIFFSYEKWQFFSFNLGYYNGFRNPNIDDIGKVFSKDGVNVVVPNAELEPEYSNNFEVSMEYNSEFANIIIQLFNSEIKNAISRQYGSINGLDSILYDGDLMRVQMNKNIASAKINGISFSGNIKLNNKLSFHSNLNYLIGKTNNDKPLAHIPPLNGKISLTHKKQNHILDFYINYNGWKLADEYDEAGIDNLDEATADGTPSWYTINAAYTNNINEKTSFTMAIKNMFDIHYKTFGSGISAGGRSFVLSLNTSF